MPLTDAMETVPDPSAEPPCTSVPTIARPTEPITAVVDEATAPTAPAFDVEAELKKELAGWG